MKMARAWSASPGIRSSMPSPCSPPTARSWFGRQTATARPAAKPIFSSPIGWTEACLALSVRADSQAYGFSAALCALSALGVKSLALDPSARTSCQLAPCYKGHGECVAGARPSGLSTRSGLRPRPRQRGQGQDRRETDQDVAGLGRFDLCQKHRAQQDESRQQGQPELQARIFSFLAQKRDARAGEREAYIEEIQQAEAERDANVYRVFLPFLRERQQLA